MDLKTLKIDRKPKSAPRRVGNPWPLRFSVIAALGLVVWLFWTPITALADRVRLPQVRVVAVVQSHPATAGAVRGTAANGYVVAARRAALSSDVPGRIVELRVTEGSVLRKGDVVARLYSDEVAAALDRAKADVLAADAAVVRAQAAMESSQAEARQRRENLKSLKALVTEAEAAAKLAKVDFDRVQDLVERGIFSPADLDSARSTLEAADARVLSAQALDRAADLAVTTAEQRVKVAEGDEAVARAQVEVAQASQKQAAATLDKMEVRAPFDGIVVLKDAEIGEVVSPNSQGGSNARGSVCTMVDFDSLEVQADVPETSLAAVQLGARASIYLDAWPEEPYPGRVDRIWPTADRQKATVEVRVAFERRDERLRPDMGVRVVFLADAEAGAEGAPGEQAVVDLQPAILIPQDAVVEIEGKTGAFVVERDTVRFVVLQLGARRSGRVAVEAGLTAGQRIVVEPPSRLQSGDRVRIEKG